MGKSEDEQPTPSHQAALQEAAAENAGARCPSCRLIGRIARPRCVASLILSLALLLSVVFWLPPFVRRYEGSGRPDKDPRFTGEVSECRNFGYLGCCLESLRRRAALGEFRLTSLSCVNYRCVLVDAYILSACGFSIM